MAVSGLTPTCSASSRSDELPEAGPASVQVHTRLSQHGDPEVSARPRGVPPRFIGPSRPRVPNLSLGSTAELLTQAVRRRPERCESLPVDHFYPLTWRETWLLVDPDQYVACSARLASSYGVHCWNTAITFGLGMPKDALPPTGSYLHRMASVVLGSDGVPAWPIDVARVWINNFNRVQDSISEIRIGSNVIGRIEKTAVNGDGAIEIAGWAFDRTRPWEPVTIMFLRDGAIVHAQRTAGVRPDVTEAYPSYRPRYVMFQGTVKPEAAEAAPILREPLAGRLEGRAGPDRAGDWGFGLGVGDRQRQGGPAAGVAAVAAKTAAPAGVFCFQGPAV